MRCVDDFFFRSDVSAQLIEGRMRGREGNVCAVGATIVCVRPLKSAIIGRIAMTLAY